MRERKLTKAAIGEMAADSVEAFLGPAHTPLNEGIAKTAVAHRLNPEEINLVCHRANRMVHTKIALDELAAGHPLTFEYPLADSTAIVSALNIKTAAPSSLDQEPYVVYRARSRDIDPIQKMAQHALSSVTMVHEIVSDISGVSLHRFHEGSSLTEDLGLDEQRKQAVFSEVERKIGVPIYRTDEAKIATVNDIVKHVKLAEVENIRDRMAGHNAIFGTPEERKHILMTKQAEADDLVCQLDQDYHDRVRKAELNVYDVMRDMALSKEATLERMVMEIAKENPGHVKFAMPIALLVATDLGKKLEFSDEAKTLLSDAIVFTSDAFNDGSLVKQAVCKYVDQFIEDFTGSVSVKEAALIRLSEMVKPTGKAGEKLALDELVRRGHGKIAAIAKVALDSFTIESEQISKDRISREIEDFISHEDQGLVQSRRQKTFSIKTAGMVDDAHITRKRMSGGGIPIQVINGREDLIVGINTLVDQTNSRYRNIPGLGFSVEEDKNHERTVLQNYKATEQNMMGSGATDVTDGAASYLRNAPV